MISPDKRVAARFVGSVRRAIQKAYIEEQRKTGISQSDIARALGVHRSVINRELKGFNNLTLGRVAQLAWALGRKPSFSLSEHVTTTGQNTAPIATPTKVEQAAPTSGTVTLAQTFNVAKAA